eukprot:1149157-Pelagomonas_calceolata.AAC.3
MPLDSIGLPPMEDAHCVMIWTALIMLSTMSGMHTYRHHKGLSLCVKAISKGGFGSFLIGMDACRNERLLDLGIQVPENISRAIPD